MKNNSVSIMGNKHKNQNPNLNTYKEIVLNDKNLENKNCLKDKQSDNINNDNEIFDKKLEFSDIKVHSDTIDI